ncbi:MAG: CPBP family intramembrane metalloprotease [Thermoclostridium sp.]|nr:CPBP family intramembrane metalloprotease [Thermoclostridium sp.]
MQENKEFKTSTIEAPKLAEAGLLYSIVAFLLLTAGAYFQGRNFISGILITEFIIILLPPLILLKLKKYDIPGVLRLKRVSLMNLFIIFFMMLFSLWIVTILNLFNLWLIRAIFGRVSMSPLPLTETSMLVNILLIGGSAGICEEVMFRGFIQRSLERVGVFWSILITGFIFGLFHMDFQKLLGTFLLGVLIGFIVYRTNSLFAGMFAHFTNNSLAVIISSLAGKIPQANQVQTGETLNDMFTMLESMPPATLISVIVVYVGSALFCAAALAGLIWAFVTNTASTREAAPRSKTEKKAIPVLAFLPGLAAIAFIYVITALGLSGVRFDFLRTLFGG